MDLKLLPVSHQILLKAKKKKKDPIPDTQDVKCMLR